MLFGPVARQADVVFELLDRPMDPAHRRQVEAVAVGLYAQAGMLAFNLNDRITARKRFALARDLAAMTRDDTLTAQAAGMASTRVLNGSSRAVSAATTAAP